MTTGLFFGDGMCNGIYTKNSVDVNGDATFFKDHIKEGMSHGIG
jgi:hypothetical protein